MKNIYLTLLFVITLMIIQGCSRDVVVAVHKNKHNKGLNKTYSDNSQHVHKPKH